MTDSSSKFQPFTLTLANSATLTGRSYTPSGAGKKNQPLLVLLHGGGCHAGYYDVDEDHTAAATAHALQIPVVSINRPCYLGTSSLFPLPENSSFHRETGRLEHSYIFPALWKTFGLPNNCSAIVAIAHSMANPGLLVAASLHAEGGNPEYPLAGLIISGWGCRRNSDSQEFWIKLSEDEHKQNRHIVMLSDPKYRTTDDKMRLCLPEQTVEPPPEEAEECVIGPWAKHFPDIAASISVPVMYAVGEHDWLWEGTFDNAREFAAFFKNCTRFDGSVVQGAPHAIEWSYYAAGWYARCFGFAIEVATHLTVMKESPFR
ncbi:hypothetical protein M409DRAFT_20701 [Zasmidium cellare ATCC 36951]|uniref:AB hydrolase-1 domain-containing protein n=1 Tax=Zasmidium cellare ATCC 36951 TaxID=1080233 RepID=A0A6A6CQB8_ZASCE|nr:uncharacterized protein M409DRAFT_20701 [Zasmidium cellare ATCC 36951]KAF2169487.1 hypothetical protein M409DRAFT_20701 [Zasmidium cellare ATCC 36951]